MNIFSIFFLLSYKCVISNNFFNIIFCIKNEKKSSVIFVHTTVTERDQKLCDIEARSKMIELQK